MLLEHFFHFLGLGDEYIESHNIISVACGVLFADNNIVAFALAATNVTENGSRSVARFQIDTFGRDRLVTVVFKLTALMFQLYYSLE